MDPQTQDGLFADARQVLGGRSALAILHQFITVRLADRIHVLDRGPIVEEGSHDELMRFRSRYAHLYALQAGAYA
jgi:ABC-type multidrug transport system fused ATPase/permease subunit